MGSGREFTAKYGASVTGFKSGMEQMVAELDKYNNALVKNQQQQKACNKIINEAQKELDKLEKEAKAGGGATEEQKKKIEELNAKIEAETKLLAQLKTEQTGLKNAISETTKQLGEQDGAAKKNVDAMEKYRDAMKNAGQAGKELATEVAAVGAAAVGMTAGIYSFVKAGARWADDLNTLGKTTGIATAELQKFEYASKLIDVSTETMTGSLTKLTRNMQSAKDGSGAAAEAFKTLKVDVTDASGNLRDRQDVFEETISALGEIESETERDALAMEIFGKSAQQLNPLIKGGAERLRELGDEAEKMGLILDQKTLDKLNEFNDSVDLLGAKGNQITKILASQAQPAVEGLVKVGDELLAEIKELADSGELEKYAKEVGALIEAGARALKDLLVWIGQNKEMMVGFTAALVGFKAAMSVGTLVNNLVIGIRALKSAEDSAAASQIALNTAMNANPIGIVVGLVAALAAGITAYSFAANVAAQDTGEFAGAVKTAKQACEEFDAAQKNAADNYKKTVADAAAEAATLEKLNERYNELRAQAALTAAEKTELEYTAQRLAQALGTETTELQSQSGQWQDVTARIEEYNKTLKDRAEIEARQELYKETIKERIRLEMEYAEKEKEARKYYEENAEAIRQMNEIGYMSELTEEYKAYNKLTDGLKELQKRIDGAKESESEYARSISEASEQAEKQASTSSGAAADINAYGSMVAGLADDYGELASSISSADDKLTAANKELLDNQQAITAARQELKEAEKKLRNWDDGSDLKELYDTYKNEYEGAKDRIAQLLTEQVKLRKNVADIKEEVKAAGETAEDAISGALGELESLGSLLGKVEKEITDSGSLSLGTLNSIIKKYPELTGAVDDYINGLTDEKEIISGLKKAYDKDIDAYQAAISLKKLANGEFTEDMSRASAELVNKYKEHYGIDLQNFTTAAAAKAAVQDRLDKALEAAREKQEAVRGKYTFGNYQGRNYIISGGETYYEGTAQYTAARKEMDKANSGIVSAVKELKDFDGDEFVKTLTADLLKAYGGSSIDAQKLRSLGKSPESTAGKSSGGGSSGSSGGGSKNTLWKMKSGSVYGEGSTKLGAWLNWLDNGTARGKNSDRDILNVLQKIKKEGGWTPAEIETIEKRIYDIQKKIADQKAKDEEDRLKSKEQREAEARKKQEEAEKEAHDAQMTRLEYAKAAYERFYSGRKKSLEEENKRISENAAAEIAKLDEAAKKRKEQKEDDDISKRLREVEDQIEFGQNDEFTLKRLRRQRQDILNERSDIEFDRNLEKQKISIQQKAEEAVQKNTLALEKLEKAMENAAYTFARAGGTLSAAQVVNHSTAVTNNNYLRQGLSLTDYMSLITALI